VKIAGGSLDDVRRRFAEHADASLEDVFFKATDDPPSSPEPTQPPVLTAAVPPPSAQP
jgi:hypothetical protein